MWLKYSTISVPTDVKRTLEKAKGEDEWGGFLLKLYVEATRSRGEKAFLKLADTVTKEDLKAITESSKEFREKFTFR